MLEQKDWKYTKAVPTKDPHIIVYAFQFTEKDWDFMPAPPQMSLAGKIIGIELCGELEIISPNDWIIWHIMQTAYEIISDKDFREKFTLYPDLPPTIKIMADKYPSYDGWVEQTYKQDV